MSGPTNSSPTEPSIVDAVIVGSPLPPNTSEILVAGDVTAKTAFAHRFPEFVVACYMRSQPAAGLVDFAEAELITEMAQSAVVLDDSDFNATELFNWFTRHERYVLALRLVGVWRDRSLAMDTSAELLALRGFAFQEDQSQTQSLPDTACALALAACPESQASGSSPALVDASAVTGFAVVDLEAQIAAVLDALAGAGDALGYGALTLARHPSVGEPGVNCNRTLINVLCGDCRNRAHHNALDTLRNRLQGGQLRVTEMLEHVLAAIKNCGGIRRVHLLEADLSSGMLRSRRRLHVRGAVPFQPLDVSIGAAPALESLLLSPQSRMVSPESVHPDVAALAESPLLPGRYSVVGSLLAGERPQGIVVADAEGLPIDSADATRVHDLVQLAGKLLSLLVGEGETWRNGRESASITNQAAAG